MLKLFLKEKADNFWEYIVQLIDSDYESILDAEACQPGDTTRFLSNVMPEYHSEGYTQKLRAILKNTEHGLKSLE